MTPPPAQLSPAPRPLEEPTRSALAIGMGWFPEQAGNGLDRVFHALAAHLPGAGVAVRGLVAGSGEVARQSGGRVAAFAPEAASVPRRLVAARRAARAAVARDRPDLVAAHFALYALPALGAMAGLPLVVHFHGPWADESAVEGAGRAATAAKRAVERAVYRRADRVIVLSRAFAGRLVEGYRVPESRVRVVPGGVDTGRFDVAETRAQARERLGWPPDRPVVLTVRRLARRMGLDGLIDAVGALRQRVPDVLLVVAGTGPLGHALAARAQALGASAHVRFAGFVPEADLPLAYRAADVSVVPTVALEGFGLTTVESLAAGTPVVVTPMGGLPEVVAGLSPALVCESAAPAAVADRLAAVLTGALEVPDADACRQYAAAHFAWPDVARQVADVYREVAP